MWPIFGSHITTPRGGRAMSEALFNLSEHYDEMLRKGVSLSGEDPAFFLYGRVDDLRKNLPSGFQPARILDFGCGTGESSACLGEVFPGSNVLGIDTAVPAIELAQRRHGNTNIRFNTLDAMPNQPAFDLCYVNGVFHHIEPSERASAVRNIFNSLNPGGYFALFENNPWNPGTRMVMKRIPFDRDAITLSYLETQNMVQSSGFKLAGPTRFLFYFPKVIGFLRPLEPALTGIPLGAQYYVLGVKPTA
jgi:SAM-dependent methyltransferase